MASSSKQRYTDPALREKLKERIKRGDKGGKSGQWSAVKSLMLAITKKYSSVLFFELGLGVFAAPHGTTRVS